jgi:hypothetical protein
LLGPIHPAAKTGHFTKGAISLAVNGTVKQNSDLRNMIWSVAEQISKLSEAFELKPGDIIYSGTPENVGPVVKGDVLLCKLEGLPDMSIRIVEGSTLPRDGPAQPSDRQIPGCCADSPRRKPQPAMTLRPSARISSSAPLTSSEAMPRPRSARGVSVWVMMTAEGVTR